MYFTFVMEQTLGHVTHCKNLHQAVAQESSVEADWLLIDFPPVPGNDLYAWLEKAPVIRNNWSLRAGIKTRKALIEARRQAAVKPDLYFFHTQVTALFGVGLVKNTPKVISLDATPINYDSVGSAYNHKRGDAFSEFLKFKINQRALQSANRLITWCDWAKQSLINDYKVQSEIAVIAPGTDLSLWQRRADEYNTQNEQPVRLLFVGGAFKRKGGELLLDVFRRNFMGQAELHLVTQEKLELSENERNSIFVYNNVTSNSPQLQSLFKKADVFVLPTEADCLPVVMGEAMAAGLPIVTTQVGAIPEVVTDGYNGMTIKPGDGAALTKALGGLITSATLRRTLGANGRKRAETDHDAAKNALQIIEWCKGAIGAPQNAKVVGVA